MANEKTRDDIIELIFVDFPEIEVFTAERKNSKIELLAL